MKKSLILLWLCAASTVSYGQTLIKISQIFNLQTSLNAKANLASPVFTGNPQVPNQTAGSDNANAANTKYVDDAFAATTIYFATGTFTHAGSSGDPYQLGFLTSNNTLTGVYTYNQNGIGTTPTTAIGIGNATASTNTITAQYGGGTDYFSHAWNTTSGSDDVLHMQLYNKPASGSITFSTLNLDVWTNNGSHVSAWSVNSLGQMSVGQSNVFGQSSTGTFLTKPGSLSAINSTTTATAAQIAAQVITSTSVAATSITLPSANSILTQINGVRGTHFPLRVDNIAGANTVTIVLPGSITSGSTGTPLTINAGTAALYEIYWPTTTTAVIYRVGQ